MISAARNLDIGCFEKIGLQAGRGLADDCRLGCDVGYFGGHRKVYFKLRRLETKDRKEGNPKS